MNNPQNDEVLEKQLDKLRQKYGAMGQDMTSYLDGLLHADFLTYWDYIHLDTLLSLQNPKTQFPDEKIFILYHQITELYFKLILNELDQLIFQDNVGRDEFLKRIKRCVRYFRHLTDSFDVMIEGMDPEQFLQFRMSLLPASGFQSGQYRQIEIVCTDFHLLTRKPVEFKGKDFENIFENLYWKQGATELATGKKTLTLKQFENKYRNKFILLAKDIEYKNIRRKFLDSFSEDEEIKAELKKLDREANANWPLVHMRSAARYLQKDPVVLEATGGTNWQKYLPPRNQMIQFYPELWTEEESKDWGRAIIHE